MKKKQRLIILAVAVICAVGIGIRTFSSEKIRPGIVSDPVPADPRQPEQTVSAAVESITEWYEAVGTTRPRTETTIGAQITARIKDVKVKPGDRVRKGQLLVLLDDSQFLSRLNQVRQALNTARSGKEQARQGEMATRAAFAAAQAAWQRTKAYYASEAATDQDMEQAEAAYLQARAELRRAGEAVTSADTVIRQTESKIEEAMIALGYTGIKAPEDGSVLKRFVEPGDLALPGKPLLLFQTTGRLRLEAHVREGLIGCVHTGDCLNVDISTLDRVVEARVEEIVPYSDPQSRTFLVKALIPSIPGIYPGMFGKLKIPVRQRQVIAVPRMAVKHVGQMELVMVDENGRWEKRLIKTGQSLGDRVEVLSGLTGSETIGLGR